jgi:hypothetical protein
MKKKDLLILLLLFPLSLSCVYDFQADIEEASSLVVVEGDIQVGGITSISFFRDGNTVLFSAVVEGEDGTSLSSGMSRNICNIDTRNLDPTVRYRIRIYDMEAVTQYVSSWENVRYAPVIDSLSYSIDGDVMDIRATFHADAQESPYYCLSYREQWEYRSYTTSYFRYVAPGEMFPVGGRELFPEPSSGLGNICGRIFRVDDPYPNNACWMYGGTAITDVVTTGAMTSNKMVDYTFKSIGREESRLSVKYRVIVSLRLISPESYTFWESLDRSSSQTGDLFSPIPSQQRGNIVCEEDPNAIALGYIGVSASTQKELVIRAEDVHFYREPASIKEMLEEEAIGLKQPYGVPVTQMAGQYSLGYRPWRRVSLESGGTEPEAYFIWLPERCMDCTTQGGSTTKPSDWPE